MRKLSLSSLFALVACSATACSSEVGTNVVGPAGTSSAPVTGLGVTTPNTTTAAGTTQDTTVSPLSGTPSSANGAVADTSATDTGATTIAATDTTTAAVTTGSTTDTSSPSTTTAALPSQDNTDTTDVNTASPEPTPGTDDTGSGSATDNNDTSNVGQNDGSSDNDSSDNGGSDNSGAGGSSPIGDDDNGQEPDDSGGGDPNCVDIVDADATCAERLEWENCEDQWLLDGDYCAATCGRCDSGGSSSNGDNGSDNGGDNGGQNQSGGDLGDDNPFSQLNGGSQGWASRYWDCCKPSCGWSGNTSSPIASCDKSDSNPGVDDMARNACEGGGTAYTCHSNKPWAYSNTLSYGYAAVKAQGAACGKCYQLQFTGRGQHVADDSGSVALNGKTMVVAVTNIGGDVDDGQFDILIPGGGVGAFNACSDQWGVSADQLGAQYGGFRTACDSSGDPKGCVRQKCEEIFGSKGLNDLMDGCIWYVDWFEAANNPQFVYQEVNCPSELQ